MLTNESAQPVDSSNAIERGITQVNGNAHQRAC
jgi:hypothetical protein